MARQAGNRRAPSVWIKMAAAGDPAGSKCRGRLSMRSIRDSNDAFGVPGKANRFVSKRKRRGLA